MARAASDQAAGAELAYEGLVTRAIAFAMDAAIIDLVAILVAAGVALALSVLSVPDSLDTALIIVGGAAFVLWTIGYFVTFWSSTGQTPGNRLMRIRVCRAADGAAPRPGQALLRLAAMTLAAIPLMCGFLTILVDHRRRGLHDMLAGTVVVTVQELAPASYSSSDSPGASTRTSTSGARSAT